MNSFCYQKKYFNQKNLQKSFKKILLLFLSTSILLGCTTSSNEFNCGTPAKGYCASLDEVNQMVDAQKISDKAVSKETQSWLVSQNLDSDSKNHLIWVAPHSDELGYHTSHYLEEPVDALF